VTDAIFHPAVALEQIPEGGMRCVTVAGREVLICRTREGVFALDNICSHAYAQMHEGRLRGVRLICPLHGASFDVRDGRVLGAPATEPLVRHEVRVLEGMVQVALAPARAEPSAHL
jgi:3-phenylpropionate/trans-cinnamate dioxygenase ferredoxin subunit